MILTIAVLLICCIFLLARLFFIKKEIINIKNQLDDYNNVKTHKKIDVKLFNKEIEDLSFSINKYIDINVQAKVMQKKAEDELKRAIANISHDLRTPLTSVIGYIQMIKSKNLSKDKQQKYIEIAERRAKSLQTLLSNFFELSVVESPEYKLSLEYVNLNNILCEVITSFYESFNDKNITPEISIPNENIMVLGTTVSIKRVIENLVINIIKHSSGKVSISLKKDKKVAVLTTSNLVNNFTIDDANLIFNKFYKADISRTSNNSNTGLGLAIAKSLMEKMNGEIYADLKGDLLYIFCKWKIKNNERDEY